MLVQGCRIKPRKCAHCVSCNQKPNEINSVRDCSTFHLSCWIKILVISPSKAAFYKICSLYSYCSSDSQYRITVYWLGTKLCRLHCYSWRSLLLHITDGSGFHSRQRYQILLFCKRVYGGYRAQTAPSPQRHWVPWSVFLDPKRQWRKADLHLPSWLGMCVAMTPRPLYVFMACTGTTLRDRRLPPPIELNSSVFWVITRLKVA